VIPREREIKSTKILGLEPKTFWPPHNAAMQLVCMSLLCCGPNGLVVRASDGLEFKSQLVPEFDLWI